VSRFFASYGQGLELANLKANWLLEGPQKRENLPSNLGAVFDDPEVLVVVVQRRGGGGTMVRRMS
jgi:hypothetical protein